MIISDENFSITSEQDVQSICQPLFSKTDITYFHYARIYDDGSVSVLISDAAWHKYYWEREFFSSLHDTYFVESGLCLTTALPNYSQEVNDARNQFNMDHKFEIIEQYNGYSDIFGFATTPGRNEIVNFYFNHLRELKQFNIYFKEKAAPLIRLFDKKENRLRLPKSVQLPLKRNVGNEILQDNLKGFLLESIAKKFLLTKREIDCLIHLLRNRTAKESAVSLDIQPKTVEDHIKRIKAKLNCFHKAALFDKAQALGLIDLI